MGRRIDSMIMEKVLKKLREVLEETNVILTVDEVNQMKEDILDEEWENMKAYNEAYGSLMLLMLNHKLV
jgi:uncharacterized membrane-anchored protein YitT (DUF2179 family)